MLVMLILSIPIPKKKNNLDNASFFGVDAYKLKIQFSSLKNANIYGAELKETDFTGSNLSDAYLNSSIITNSNFDTTNLTHNTQISYVNDDNSSFV